jgi:hypothetical protein
MVTTVPQQARLFVYVCMYGAEALAKEAYQRYVCTKEHMQGRGLASVSTRQKYGSTQPMNVITSSTFWESLWGCTPCTTYWCGCWCQSLCGRRGRSLRTTSKQCQQTTKSHIYTHMHAYEYTMYIYTYVHMHTYITYTYIHACLLTYISLVIRANKQIFVLVVWTPRTDAAQWQCQVGNLSIEHANDGPWSEWEYASAQTAYSIPLGAYTQAHVYIYIYIYMYLHGKTRYIYICVYVRMYVCIYIYIYIYIPTHTHTYRTHAHCQTTHWSRSKRWASSEVALV